MSNYLLSYIPYIIIVLLGVSSLIPFMKDWGIYKKLRLKKVTPPVIIAIMVLGLINQHHSDKRIEEKDKEAKAQIQQEQIQRAETEKKFKELLYKQDYIFRQFYIPQRYPAAVDFHNTVTMSVKTRVIHANGQADIKDRVEDLSTEINNFLTDRERNSPPLPTGVTTEADINNTYSYFKETINQYSIKFTPQVVAIRNELASKGLRDEQLDKYYEHPTNLNEIRIVAERINALAGRVR